LKKEKKERERKNEESEMSYKYLGDFSPLTERVFVSGKQSSSFTMHSISDSNYFPVSVETVKKRRRPSIVPKLDVFQLPHYDSSDSENEKINQDKQNRGLNPKETKKILDGYNIHTCARNLMQQEKNKEQRVGSSSFESLRDRILESRNSRASCKRHS